MTFRERLRPIKVEKHWELSPQELHGLFGLKGWVWKEGFYTPPPAIIEASLDQQVASLRSNRNATFNEAGRFYVFRDPEFPGSYNLALQIGWQYDVVEATVE